MTPHQPTATLKLREMILRGELKPGERLLEMELAERLGTSRMPIRQALPALAQEGLLAPAGRKGYCVRVFTTEQTQQALRLRAMLEGFAARSLAERGAPPAVIAALRVCLAEGDRILAQRDRLDTESELAYGDMNKRFHSMVLEAANVPLVSEFTSRCNLVPFTSPESVAFGGREDSKMSDLLFYAHRQHHSIVQAIEAGHGDRAEFLFREHALTQEESQSL
ncbi:MULTISPECIES: GntR family transcriptional regulator [Paraburkholderia]|uniref:GntR family transcriptional regulator n=1 Tax=Paraburkholderia podalyriae TaxID=1938811 RepID=A0ABR7PTE0_9BURK|nr:GntR family transcriptional regulator [Paraburkholderia podalyriae]MBC8749549.1 GntR family transcriptional regulator [Paraburkholderia podalyriae]